MVVISIFKSLAVRSPVLFFCFPAETLEVDVSRLLAALTVLNIALHLN
jgi:hypothetical protein